jgi:IclR family acetate operon transcriptional repressor
MNNPSAASDHVASDGMSAMVNVEQASGLNLGTIEKGLGILEMLARMQGQKGCTLGELREALGMNRTTLFRFLSTFRTHGYIERDAITDRYHLGIRVLFLSSALLNGMDIRKMAKPLLDTLCEQTQELVQLTTIDHGDMVTIERVLSKQTLALQTAEIGARRPAYCTATGKATFAYLPREEVDRILAAGMPAVTPRTITTPEAMHANLAEARKRGYAWDDEEWIPDVRCVAAPIFDHEGHVAATVSVAAPMFRTPLKRLWRLGEMTKAIAEAISRQMGA